MQFLVDSNDLSPMCIEYKPKIIQVPVLGQVKKVYQMLHISRILYGQKLNFHN